MVQARRRGVTMSRPWGKRPVYEGKLPPGITPHSVSITGTFDASDPIDAVKQMVEWLTDLTYVEGLYVVDSDETGEMLVDASTIDFDYLKDDNV